jgi:2-keto-4-pentenoate hydratase/2-oxohepta-3-ene-1,7-dioic acid hydratase in catechol pathway
MRIANIAGRAHLVIGDRAADIAKLSAGRFPFDPMDLLAHWPELRAWASRVEFDGSPIDSSALGPPVPRPRQVFAVASNYRDRPTILDTPTDLPIVFTKFPASIVGPHAAVPLPTSTVDWEVELVAVIGSHAHNVPVSGAWDAVAGLTVGQDLSERTLQLGGQTKQFSLGKSYPAFGPIGPVLVTPDELPDRDHLHLTCSVNGEIVQDAHTSQMIFSVPTLVARLSAICPLLPGDLIFTGTPGGMGMTMSPPRYLKVGDEIHSHIPGIGSLHNQCVE